MVKSMVSQTPPIAASLVSVSNAEVPFDKGVVDKQIDPSTFIIRIPAGDITVRVPEGSLTVGDSVSIAQKGDAVLIAIHSLPLESMTTFGDSVDLQIGTTMDELMTLLQELQSDLSSSGTDNRFNRLLESAIAFFAEKKYDASALLLLLTQLKGALFSQTNTTLLSENQESLHRLGTLLTEVTEYFSSISGGVKEDSPYVVSLTQSPETGLYYLTDREEALKLLVSNSVETEHSVNQMLKAFSDKPIFLYFYESTPGTTKAMAMSYETLLNEIEHILRAEMKSESMQRLDPKLIAALVRQKGRLPLSQLVAIDRLLCSVAGQDKSLIVRGDALSVSLAQLVAVALEAGDTRIPDFPAALQYIGSRMPDLVNTILTWLDTQKNEVKLVDLKRILYQSLSAEQFSSVKRDEAIPSLFKHVGFSLEHDLYQAVSNRAGINTDSPSFKLALLLILSYVNNFAEQQDGEGIKEKEGGQRAPMFSSAAENLSDSPKSSVSDTGAVERDEPASRISVAMVRQQIETVLNRFESLQMLAKPVVSAEGEQQVLILPVHIGDEWSEIRIKFVKERRKKGQNKPPGHITVTLNMTLSLLGEISASMEYKRSKHLRVSLTFDNPLARNWFQKYKKEMCEALNGLDIPAVQLHLTTRSIRTRKKSVLHTKAPGQQAHFDVLG